MLWVNDSVHTKKVDSIMMLFIGMQEVSVTNVSWNANCVA